MTRENPIRDLFQPPHEMPTGFRNDFFQTVAGPDETPYPAEGESNVYYAERLKNVGFAKAIGTTALSSTGTGKKDYIFNLSTDDYIEEGSIVWCFRRNGQWFTIDKVKAQLIYGVTHNSDELTLLDPSDGSEIDTFDEVGVGPGFVSDGRMYFNNGAFTLSGLQGGVGVGSGADWRAEYRRSVYASGREILSTSGLFGRRHTYDLEGNAELQATYQPAINSLSTEWCSGIDEFSDGNIICAFGQTARNWVAGYERDPEDPESSTDVDPTWYYPTTGANPQMAECMRRINPAGEADTFVAGMNVPAGASAASYDQYFSLIIFSATASAFGSVLQQIKLHGAPYSNHANEAATEQDQFIGVLDVLPVPDGDGDFYVLSGYALDEGVGYSWWRLESNGTLVWRHSEENLATLLSGNAAVDPVSGDLIAPWTDITNPSGSAADYGVLRLAKADGSLVWKTTLGTTNLGGLSPERPRGIAAGRVKN